MSISKVEFFLGGKKVSICHCPNRELVIKVGDREWHPEGLPRAIVAHDIFHQAMGYRGTNGDVAEIVDLLVKFEA